MAAVYVDEEEVWKCLKHPSKRRKTGICHICLRERLAALCPDCGNVRPCPCCATTSDSSSSSSDGVRVAKILESEPSFRRSRSVAIPSFLRSSSRYVGSGGRRVDLAAPSDRPPKTPSFWSNVFRSSRRSQPGDFGVQPEPAVKKFGEIEEVRDEDEAAEMRRTMMMRSRSVAVPMVSNNSGSSGKPPVKGRGWHFPSPIKAFRHSKISKIGTERSPVYRG
ncbi:uncharacterized protein LOC126794777 [Argentina anserina]|uniref:uncharacterized protein LOC126794777 n=1 Tax=Argentina anserina TaxID=57926 RepID=UPI0021766028|nr:uncharacterized protein LOC126794777 [Potentilla anserina]